MMAWSALLIGVLGVGATSALAGTEDSGVERAWGIIEVLTVCLRAGGLCIVGWIGWRLAKVPGWPLQKEGGLAGKTPVLWGFVILVAAFVIVPMVERQVMSVWMTGPSVNGSMKQNAEAFWLEYALNLPVLGIWVIMCRDKGRSGRATLMRAIGEGIIGIALVLPVVMLTEWLGVEAETLLRGATPNPIAHQTLETLTSTTHDVWWWVASVGLVSLTPVKEEVVFRGTIQRMLAGVGARGEGGREDRGEQVRVIRAAVVVSAVVFAAMHCTVVPSAALPALFVLAVGLGMMYERTGRIITPIVMHGLFNAWNIGMAMMLEHQHAG